MATEKRLIDLLPIDMNEVDTSDCTDIEDILSAVITYLSEQPTVDAVEVVHGHWDIFDDGYGCEIMCCSICKAEFYDGDNDTVDHTHNYCPDCGAKMDGDGNA